MPLDNLLNRDIQLSHDTHCVLTNHLPLDDLRRFLKATPNLIDRGVRRIWDHSEGAPNSKRIVHDIEKAAQAMVTVMLAKGKMVPNLVNQNGHRNEKAGQSTRRSNGGVRIHDRDWENDKWQHPMIRDVVKQRMDMIVQKCNYSSSSESE